MIPARSSRGSVITDAQPKRSRPSPEDLAQLKRLFAFTKPYRRYLILGILAVGVASLLGLVFPAMVRELFNSAFLSEGGMGKLNLIALSMLVVFALQAFFNYFRTYYLALVGEGVVADLRKKVFEHLMSLPISFFESRKTGEITSRLSSDVTTVQAVVSQALAQFLSQGITLVGGTIYLCFLNYKLTLVMLAVLPAVIIAGSYFGRQLRKVSTGFQDKVADANASAEEAITGIRIVKSFTAEKLESERYGEKIASSYEVALRRAKIRALFIPSIIMAMFIGISTVLWVGGRLVIAGELPGGDLIAFLLLTVFVAGSIGSFTGLYSQFQEALGASKRIFELLDERSDLAKTEEPLQLSQSQGEVRFEQVSFGYGDRGEENVLKDINLHARPGEVIALVGPSGSGKSTLVSLIPRFYDPSEGNIYLDGKPLSHISLENLRGHIGIVPQESQLFSGTIFENIRYGRPEASFDEVIMAAKAANADEFISAFPQGYETIVGERGIKLSGGQRQRVAIARALLKNPRILILDEATSSLDSESEALVQEALEHLMQGRTTFVIAHRLSTIRNADRILVLEDGNFIQEGTHESLLVQGGLYKELHDKQFNTSQ
ncbi:MAG: ABC transporter transmembrane domain-containing protein [Deinococcales bacterium]